MDTAVRWLEALNGIGCTPLLFVLAVGVRWISLIIDCAIDHAMPNG